MNPNLTRLIKMARHRLEGVPLDKDDQLEQEHAKAVNAFNDRLVELMSFSLRVELFFGAKWFWGILGPSVQFEVDGNSFLLIKNNESYQLFLHADGRNKLLITLSDDDKQCRSADRAIDAGRPDVLCRWMS